MYNNNKKKTNPANALKMLSAMRKVFEILFLKESHNQAGIRSDFHSAIMLNANIRA